MRTFVTPAFQRSLKGMTEERRGEIIAIIKRVAECYGHPHKHHGLGIRPIGLDMECRDSLNKRLVFFEVMLEHEQRALPQHQFALS